MRKNSAAARSAQAMQERARSEALEFKVKAERERALVVVKDDHELLMLPGFEEKVGRPLMHALYAALSETKHLRGELERKAGWLKDKLREMDRALETNRFYSSTPYQNVDELQVAYGRFYESLQNAARLTSALGVHCPALHPADDLAMRARLLSYSVVQEGGDGFWRVKAGDEYAVTLVDGEPLRAFGYAEEWKAWSAVRALMNT